MTQLLTEVLRKVAELPEDRQDDVAHVVMQVLENDVGGFSLAGEQLAEGELVHESD